MATVRKAKAPQTRESSKKKQAAPQRKRAPEPERRKRDEGAGDEVWFVD